MPAWLTEGVITAIVGGFALIITGLLSYLATVATSTRRHAKAARVQVENEHRDPDGNVINMREEFDSRHSLIVNLITGIQSDIRGMRRDHGRMEDRFEKHLEEAVKAFGRLDAIEDTIPRDELGRFMKKKEQK